MRRRLNIQSFGVLVCALGFSGLSAQADAPSGHYATAAGGTVMDKMTKLTWQQTAPTSGGDDGNGGYTWTNAKTYCSTLSLNGLTGWRLPTVKELASILDLTTPTPPLIDPTAFPTATSDTFWSATPRVDSPTVSWSVDFNLGATLNWQQVTIFHVRCVR